MYHVSAQGVEERMLNVHDYYYYELVSNWILTSCQQHRVTSGQSEW